MVVDFANGEPAYWRKRVSVYAAHVCAVNEAQPFAPEGEVSEPRSYIVMSSGWSVTVIGDQTSVRNAIYATLKDL